MLGRGKSTMDLWQGQKSERAVGCMRVRKRLFCGNRTRPRALAKSGWLYALTAVLCAALLFATPRLFAQLTQPLAPSSDAGLFSWSAEEVNKTDGKLFSLMKQEKLNVLYQSFSDKNSRQEQMSVFVETAMEEGIKVYHLTGDPSWGTDPKGERLCQAVEEANAYNRRIKRKFLERREKDGQRWKEIPQLAGIVFDVEPYILKEWDKDPEKVMNSFVSGMKAAYALAQDYGLEVIVCVPWHYDQNVQQKGLEELIKSGCDSIAVMNYYRGSEIKNIATEVELVKKHAKGLITIYELQEADGRGVREINTYAGCGLDAVKKNYDGVREAYPEQRISLAYHDYRALKGMLER